MATKEKEVTKTELTKDELIKLGIEVDELPEDIEVVERPEDQDDKEVTEDGTTESENI